MAYRIRVLCENSVAAPFGLVGEHGWAAWVETPDGEWLFDTGQGVGLARNASALRIDLSRARGIALSHGHYDHTTGLPDALRSRTRPVSVFAHPDAFLTRYWVKDGNQREIGIPFKREFLESLGAQFDVAREFREIGPGVFLTGEIPRVTDFEPTDPTMKLPDGPGRWRQDPLLDDQALVLDTPEGLVVVLGCAHSGLVNTLRHIRSRMPNRPIHTVVGGTHLGFAQDRQFEQTLDHLAEFEVKRLAASHCTGLGVASRLAAALGERFSFAAVGVTLEVG
ncbi:MBL fold metallo-hydrolase [Deferrisoma sp.]